MTRKLPLLLLLWIPLLGLLVTSAFLLEIEPAKAADVPVDKGKEAEFKEASENEGCGAIPYADLKGRCPALSREVKTYCKTVPMRCRALQGDLDKAKRAGDKKRIEEIRIECLHRQGVAESCVSARANVMAIFNRAKLRLEADKKTYENALTDARAELRSKTRKRSVTVVEAAITHYERMIGYSDLILAHFAEEETEHDRVLEQYKDVVDDCKTFNHNFGK